MKTKFIVNSVIISLSLWFTLPALAQVDHNQVPGAPSGQHNYLIHNLQPSEIGATFSYLWWFGDNGFRFSESPTYMHCCEPNQDSCDMIAIVTENYGSAGPPPMPYTVETYHNSGVPIDILQPGDGIYLQHYRNAVLNDTMYLILTYKNVFDALEGGIAGRIILDLDPNLTLMTDYIDSFPQFLPNQESFTTNGQNKLHFSGLDTNEERSVLIPVHVSPNTNTDSVNVTVRLQTEYGMGDSSGWDMYNISSKVEVSHDPNMMNEKSEAENKCAYGGEPIDYTIKFQNIGEAPTHYIKVKCYLDDRVNLRSITNIKFPARYKSNELDSARIFGYDVTNDSVIATWKVDSVARTITFVMNNMVLQPLADSNCRDIELTRDQVSFRINVEDNYVFGDSIISYSEIIFDANAPILTDTVSTSCKSPQRTANVGNNQPCKYSCWICFLIGIAVGIIITLILVWLFRRSKRKKLQLKNPKQIK